MQPRKYPIDALQVGESVILPWPEEEKSRRGVKRIEKAVRRESIRYHKKFTIRVQPYGVKVTRIS